MKKIINLIFILISLITVSSCYNDVFQEEIFRTTEDPYKEVPVTDSLIHAHTVYLSWGKDEGADTYRLMRATDNSILFFNCVYEGTSTSFTDVSLNNNERYIYRLDKTRGSRLFSGDKYAYGYSAECQKDIYEPNDTEANATYLEFDLNSNITCVKYQTNNIQAIDCDWYYVNIPPYRNVEIVIVQNDLPNQTTGAETYLYIQEPSKMSEKIKQSVGYVISNPTNKTVKKAFKVYPETTQIFSSSSYTAVIDYSISLNKLFKY